MKSNKAPISRITNKITNSNFIKTPPTNNKKNAPVVHTSSINSHHSKTMILKVKSARQTSVLNIANMNLESLPLEIFDENVTFDDINWWEMVEIKKLDASNNKLNSETYQDKSEVYNFSMLPSLNYLKFSFNLFTFIPETLFNLFNLKYLDFSNNKLTLIQGDIKSLKSLVELNLSNNLISSIPDEIAYLKELEILNVSVNKIVKLPLTIGNLVKLKRLNLSENALNELPIEINKLYLLEELILFKNRINSEPNSHSSKDDQIILEGLSNLKYLDLHNNFLTTLTNLPYSNKLDTIIVGYNKIEKIEGLKNSPNLSVLDLNNNKISFFPEEILLLKELKTLNLMNNSINDIPAQICFLKALVRINLEGNPLKKINSKVRSSNAENLKAYLKTRLTEDDIKNITDTNDLMDVDTNDANINYHNKNMNSTSNNLNAGSNNNFILNYYHNNALKLNNLMLDAIPFDQMKKCINLNFLISMDFSNNQINNLDGFENFSDSFKDLKEIKFSNNKIKLVPTVILNFDNIKMIELKNNLLSNFILDDQDLNHLCLPNLEYLDLSVNKFKNVPSIIKYFKKLSVFLISNNQIVDMSNLYSTEFPNLDTLDLGNNKIDNIKEKIYKNFPNLKNFNLENNEIKNVPTDLCLLISLNKLNLNGNPIKMLRSNVINGGIKMILEYLRKMHKFDGEDVLYDQISMANLKTNVNSSLNKKDEILNSNCNNIQKIEIKNSKKQKSELDIVNEEILQVESELASNPNIPMFKKVDLKKRLQFLIRTRANLMK